MPWRLGKQRVREERRRTERFRSPRLTLTIDGHKYRTIDWSLGGFRIAGLHLQVRVGTQLSGTVSGLGWLSSGEFVADVVWASPDGEVGMRIIEIESAVFAAMAAAAGS